MQPMSISHGHNMHESANCQRHLCRPCSGCRWAESAITASSVSQNGQQLQVMIPQTRQRPADLPTGPSFRKRVRRDQTRELCTADERPGGECESGQIWPNRATPGTGQASQRNFPRPQGLRTNDHRHRAAPDDASIFQDRIAAPVHAVVRPSLESGVGVHMR